MRVQTLTDTKNRFSSSGIENPPINGRNPGTDTCMGISRDRPAQDPLFIIS
jgi:hypothetical protein